MLLAPEVQSRPVRTWIALLIRGCLSLNLHFLHLGSLVLPHFDLSFLPA